MMFSAQLLFCVLLWVGMGSAHIRLLYPPARKYAIDALSNNFIPGVCGMPRENQHVTPLKSGSTFNVSWWVGSAHEGGIRVELLDKEYNLITTLVPSGGGRDEFFGNNTVANLAQVTLPKDLACARCVLRVAKLGRGWKQSPESPHPPFVFSTCADLSVSEDEPACEGISQRDGPSCRCEDRFSGNVCQYEEECMTDADCNTGTCISTDSQAFPKRQCYCPFGWHGLNCGLESSVKSFEFIPKLYRSRSAPLANLTFYWRILEEIGEIEVVVTAKNNNWISVGWRPDGLNTSCKTFPEIRPENITSLSQDGELVTSAIIFYDKLLTGPLHPMSCNDITFATAVGKLSRVRDMYTRDIATPREDEVFGGTNDLTAALAFEDTATGLLTVLFRKQLADGGKTLPTARIVPLGDGRRTCNLEDKRRARKGGSALQWPVNWLRLRIHYPLSHTS